MKSSIRRRALRSARVLSCVLACSACSEDPERVVHLSGADERTISGVVVDGYLEGATVFLDLNGNHVLDQGEASATTDGAGAFHLDVQLSDAQLAGAFLHAIVPDTAKDADDLGKTLAEAGKGGFTLLAPFVAASAGDAAIAAQVVSPLSALVASEMLSAGSTLQQANLAVQQKLGLTGKDLLQDFAQTGDVVLGNVARTAAIGLGQLPTSDADAGVATGGHRVLDAIENVQADLPQLIDSLGLHDATRPLDGDALKQAWKAPPAADDHGHDGSIVVDAAVPSTEHHDAQPPLDAGVAMPEPPEDARDGGVELEPMHGEDASVRVEDPMEQRKDAGLLPEPPEFDAGAPLGPDTLSPTGMIMNPPPVFPEPAPDAGLDPKRDGGSSDRRDGGSTLRL